MRIRVGSRSPFPRFLLLGLILGLGPSAPAPGQQNAWTTESAPLLVGSEEQLSSRLTALPEPIVNGVLDHGSPSVGLFLTFDENLGTCTGTLIGCQTLLTAAHCVCTLPDGSTLPGADCQNRPDLVDPTNKIVFFQHAGIYGVSKVIVNPNYTAGEGADVAVLRLAEPVLGVRPARINQARRPPTGSPGTIVGFGRTGGAPDEPGQHTGVKRAGQVVTAPCESAPSDTHVCWNFDVPVGQPGVDSNTCGGDSGGPLFLDLGAGPTVAGVTSFGNPSCLPHDNAKDADVFVHRQWIASTAGSDLHRQDCGPLPFAGEPGASILTGADELSPAQPEVQFQFEVPPGVELLATTLNGSLNSFNADLFLRQGAPATTESFDCGSSLPLALEQCGIANPEPGTWFLLAQGVAGAGPFQATVTLFETSGGAGDPPPPPGPWLSSVALPGFEAKVLINESTPGSREANCIPETLCVSGALAGRPEIFVKVIGPRPNGFLWSQLSRFTPSKVEVWLRQISTGQINYYELAAVGQAEDNVSGLQDREAFSP